MSKLGKKQVNKYLSYLNEYKKLVGFSDWKINLRKEVTYLGEKTFATVGIDIYEKELVIYLSTAFLGLTKDRQRNILIHELVHSRIRYSKEKIREFEEIETEHLVNDLVRGIEKNG